jgi:Ca2+-binding RTX toxin-like protein
MSITLSGLASDRELLENAVNATPALLDTTLVLSAVIGGIPAPSLGSATLRVSGLLAEDRVAVQNQGAGPGQVGVAGGVVSVGGVPVGSVAGGSGGDLVVSFGAFGPVAPATIERVAEALTYQTLSNTPDAARVLTISVASPGFTTGRGDVKVTVVAQNDAPAITSGGSVVAAENIAASTPVYVAAATDPDGDTLTWSLSGTDAALFDINGLGQVFFRSSPDFERPADSDRDNRYRFDVVASDGTTTTQRPVQVRVTDVIETASLTDLATSLDIAESAAQAAGGVTLDADVTFRQGQRLDGLILTAAVSPAESGETLAIRAGGAGPGGIALLGDDVLFDGVVIGRLDPSTPTALSVRLGAGATEAAVEALIEALTLRADDDTPAAIRTVTLDLLNGTVSQFGGPRAIAVTITPENDAPVVPPTLAASFAEGATGTVATVVASDADGPGGLSFTLAGPDAARFQLTVLGGEGTAVLRFVARPDFEVPADADGDNIYRVTLNTSDGVATSATDIAITVTDVAERSLLTGLARAVTFSEAQVNGGLRRLDADVLFRLGDGLDGATLTVTGLLPEDVVGVIGGPNATPGQIGVEADNITYGGVWIGTKSGGAGTPLVVTLRATATAAAVEALIEALGFSTASDTPAEHRTLRLSLVEADGSSAAPNRLPGFTPIEAPVMVNTDVFGLGSSRGLSLFDIDGDGRSEALVGRITGSVDAVDAFRFAGAFDPQPLLPEENPFAGLTVTLPGFDPVRPPGLSLTFGDIDGDGVGDVVGGFFSLGVLAWRGVPGGFEELLGADNPFAGATTGTNPRPAFADWDGDGDQDLAIGQADGTIVAFERQAGGWLQLTGAANPFGAIDVGRNAGIGFLDIMGDTRPELLAGSVRDGASAPSYTLFHNGPGGFLEVPADSNPFEGLMVARDFAFGDLDGDGRADMLVAPGDALLYAYRNALPLHEIALRVIAVDDAPAGPRTIALAAAPENAPRLITEAELLAGWSDPEGAVLRTANLAVLTSAGGIVARNADGSWTFTPPPDDETEVVFAYDITDGANTVTATATLDLLYANTAPTGSVTIAPGSRTGSFVAAAALTDPDGLGAIAWQWQRSFFGSAWEDVAGATDAAFTPPTDRAPGGGGYYVYRAVATYTDGRGTVETVAASNSAHVGSRESDVFVISNPADLLFDPAAGDFDLLYTSLPSFVLPARFEALLLDSFAAPPNGLNFTGNSLDNQLYGGDLADTLAGGAGNDLLVGLGGGDRLVGGTGNDTYVEVDAADTVVEGAGGGIDQIITTLATYTLGANFEQLAFSTTLLARLTFTGNTLDNTIFGASLADLLAGGIGNDTLHGNADRDTLTGGAGQDLLFGGGGSDLFRFTAIGDSLPEAPDTIADFSFAIAEFDRVALNAIDAVAGGADDAFTYLGADPFTGTAGELRVVESGLGVYVASGDVTGDGIADFAITIQATTTPVAAWFVM